MRSFSLRHDTVQKLSTNGSNTTDRNGHSSSSAKKKHITPINTTTTPSSADLSYKAIIFMCLLACQFGIQPIVTKKYTSTKIIKSTVILTQEIIKLIIGILGISLSNKTSWSKVSSQWTIKSWLRLALIPATIYLIQNMCSLLAYQNLDAMTYNVLNQTKTLSAAFCCYLLLGKKQSTVQILSLLLLLLAALVMEKIISVDIMLIPYYWITNFGSGMNTNDMTEDHNNNNNMISNLSSPRHFSHGVVPIMCASFLSGLAGALTQKSLQTGQRNALLFTIELCIASILILLVSFVTISDDGRQIRERGFFYEWNIHTMIPILTNSTGGILVGLVIKHAGSVRKGFALIFGILLSGLIQSYTLDTKTLSKEDMAGGLLAAISLWMHATYPYNTNGVKRKEE